MNIIDHKSNKGRWNGLITAFTEYSDYKWLALVDYLISNKCWTDTGVLISQSIIAKISGIDPAELSKKLKVFRRGK